ncbi:MAG TPA: hypothetical protein VN372_03135 [Methanospirillum sp.]|nr:hypothetical protein [Methanospirillum sp.]
MWGGGMMFPRIAVQEEDCRLLDRFQIHSTAYTEGYYIAKSVEAASNLTDAACDEGAEFFNLTSVEDVMIKDDRRINGLVINWTAVKSETSMSIPGSWDASIQSMQPGMMRLSRG